MYKLVLIRHGESQWNLENRFTGWHDVDLTDTGVAQAKTAGQLMKDAGFEFDHELPLSKGGTGGGGNLRPISKKANRQRSNKKLLRDS